MDCQNPRTELWSCAQSGKPDMCNCKHKRAGAAAAPEADYLCLSVAFVLLPHGQTSLIQDGGLFVARPLDQASLTMKVEIFIFKFDALRTVFDNMLYALATITGRRGEPGNLQF